MLELIAVLWMQEVELPAESQSETQTIDVYPGLEAECQWYGDINGRVIENLQAVCPSQAPYFDQLQARADAVIASIPEPVTTEYSFLRSNLILTWDGEDWVLVRPLPLYRREPNYPARGGERGLNAECSGLVIVGEDGSATPEAWECRVISSRGRLALREEDVFRRTSERAVENYEYLPPTGATSSCVVSGNIYQLQPGPDPEDMANLFPETERPQCPAEPWEAD